MFLIKASGGDAVCTPASPEEARQYTRISSDAALHQINHLGGIRPEATSLQITLQATQQLEGFPLAKAAFIKAAANWEAVIQTPLNIIVKVDYGPTAFGQPYDPQLQILGETTAQIVGSSGNYNSVASALLAGASTAQEVSLYNSLPSTSVPTDLGGTSQVAASTATFRALGMLNATANPTTESQLGSPPSIGFNSAFQFAFDPSAIDSNSYDFQAVATHELGHVLGFDSTVGYTQLNPSGGLSVTVWDLLRFRPGTTSNSFQTAKRIQSTGGTQVYYFGGGELGLSTGGPDGKGGDGFQASHWKAVDLTGVLIGIMDPTVHKGQARTISINDLAAIDSMGYTLAAGAGGTSGGVKLTSGLGQSGAVAPAQANQCALGLTQYTIVVPQGASGLSVTLSGNQQDDLLVRYGQPVTVAGGQIQADFKANSTGTSQTVTVTPTGSPILQTGTYYVAVGNCTTSTLNYSITATVSGGTGGDSTPAIVSLTASLTGNTLTLKGTASDSGGDLSQANAVFLDGGGHAVGTTSPFQYNFGSTASSNFTITVGNMQSFPQAVAVSLTVIDSSGNFSAPVTANFANADQGGPTVSSVTFDGRNNLMIVKGDGFTGQLQLEINGVIVAPPLRIKLKGGGTKLKIAGSGPDLNLKNGPNRLRILNDSLHSNIVVLTL